MGLSSLLSHSTGDRKLLETLVVMRVMRSVAVLMRMVTGLQTRDTEQLPDLRTYRDLVLTLRKCSRLKQKLLHHGDRARSFLYFVGKISEQYYPPLLVFILNFTTCIISSLSSGDILGILQLKYTRNNWTDFVPLTLK